MDKIIGVTELQRKFRAALRGDAVSFHTITFQRVLELARQAMPLDPDWLELTTWVERKIAAA